mgnify:CR=1 FL=1
MSRYCSKKTSPRTNNIIIIARLASRAVGSYGARLCLILWHRRMILSGIHTKVSYSEEPARVFRAYDGALPRPTEPLQGLRATMVGRRFYGSTSCTIRPQ